MVKLVVTNIDNVVLMLWWLLLIISDKSNYEYCGKHALQPLVLPSYVSPYFSLYFIIILKYSDYVFTNATTLHSTC